jgi:hypothetical protein
VTATASVRNLEFVTGLGAEQVIDYQTIPFDQTGGRWTSYLTLSAVKLCSDLGASSSPAEE